MYPLPHICLTALEKMPYKPVIIGAFDPVTGTTDIQNGVATHACQAIFMGVTGHFTGNSSPATKLSSGI
jgi:hypothetical protein